MEKGKKVDLVEQVRQLRMQTEALEQKVQHARGTQRVKAPEGRPSIGENLVVRPSRGPYYLGDDGTTRDLMSAIERMLMERPWLYRDIVEATGAGENRIKGAITALQREGARVFDVAPPGTGKALWFIPSPEVLERLVRAKRAAVRK